MKYQSKKLFVADVVKVGKKYDKKLYQGVFVVKDNHYINALTGQSIQHSSDAAVGEIGCENFVELLKKYPNAKVEMTELDILELEDKLNKNENEMEM